MRAIRWTTVAFCALLGGAALSAQPSLTTIQDTLYKADGSRFEGYAFVEWKSFSTDSGLRIAEQSIVVRISAGNLRVQLTPTTTAPGGAFYQVKFNSDGRIQFVEYWAVPPSTTELKLSNVRLPGPPSGASSESSSALQISSIAGLQLELNQRPVKGSPYSTGRAAVISSSGALNSVAGNLTDCVRVDGSTIPCSTGPLGFIDSEVPAGAINGSNRVFTLLNAPNPQSSFAVYRNGVRQKETTDYVLSGNMVTFHEPSVPMTGDLLVASYRTGQTDATPVGAAGGHLTGHYPNPLIAGGVISDFNISPSAQITEAKLALNYPTHTNANDPTAAEKAAMTGSAGAPSASNRFVTNEDPRLSDARTPITHGLLDPAHGDTAPASPARGDLIVAQGGTATWTRLPLGNANRCLTSNGLDAVWNTCLYTGFLQGAIPMVDASGNLSQSNGLRFDALGRRLSVGTTDSLSTGYFFDSTPLTGVTTITTRAGDAQASTPLARWVDRAGNDLAGIASDGRLKAIGIETRSTAQAAAIRDTGIATDPTVRTNGDSWFNSTQQARKTVEAGQIHTTGQVICSSVGGSTNESAQLGACLIPETLLGAGDRLAIHLNYEHTGSDSDWSFTVSAGSATLLTRTVNRTESLIGGRADGGVMADGTVWSVENHGNTAAAQTAVVKSAGVPGAAVLVKLEGAVATPGTDSVRLLSFMVVRYPAVSNQ